eukprot:scaffold202_cov180-Amphora_coffeaeformis.AAC.13
MEPSLDLDCKGLSCPLPIAEMSKAMNKLKCGDHIVVEGTDAAFKNTYRNWPLARYLGLTV